MKPISGRDMRRILEQRGWRLVRVRGSHHFFRSPDGRAQTIVPIHGARTLRPGIQRSIMRVAGLADEDL